MNIHPIRNYGLRKAIQETFNSAIRIAIAVLCVNSSLRAQDKIAAESRSAGTGIAQTPQLKQFINQYIAAVNAKDRKALRALYDPASQAAMAKDEKVVTEVLDDATDGIIPAEHRVTVKTIGPKEPLPLLPMEDKEAICTERPTAFLQIDYSINSSDTTIPIFLTTSGSKWCEVWAEQPDEQQPVATMQKGEDAQQQNAPSVKPGEVKPGPVCSWAPGECSKPLIVPAGYHALASGTGQYHIVRDGDESFGTITITFQANGALDPETVPDSWQAPMKIRGRQFFWRVYHTEAGGKPGIRKEVLMPNFLPRNKSGSQADYIWMRVDGPTQQAISTLAPIAHGIIRDGM